MKVVQINAVCGKGSTGKICQSISECLNNQRIENYIIYSIGDSSYSQALKCTENMLKFQALLSRIKGNYGFNSNETTRKIISKLDIIQPDIVHLHNLHSHNCNLEMLMEYLKKKHIKIVWTFHDCWAFTAYCPHYMMNNCYKWKNECSRCPLYRKYSWINDNSKRNYARKKNLINNLALTIVTPSNWLANEVKQSMFKDYPIKVINNGINLSIFKPTNSKFREKYNIEEKKFIILGVAYQWDNRKGVDVFIELEKKLDSSSFQIVLVGVTEKQKKEIPHGIICIPKTTVASELAEIYSGSDLFVNPTREEVFGLVNVEANACGLPVVTFDTGGSPECINHLSGSVVPYNDIEKLENEIIRIYETRPFKKADCIMRAQEFDEKRKYQEYIHLYNEIHFKTLKEIEK